MFLFQQPVRIRLLVGISRVDVRSQGNSRQYLKAPTILLQFPFGIILPQSEEVSDQ